MNPSVSQPTPGNRRTPNKIMRQLRRREAEQTQANCNAFDSQIAMHHLRQIIKNTQMQQQPERRISLKEPEVDNFYPDEDGGEAIHDLSRNASHRGHAQAYDYDREHPYMRTVHGHASTEDTSPSYYQQNEALVMPTAATPAMQHHGMLHTTTGSPSHATVYASARRGSDNDLSRALYEEEVAELMHQKASLENELTSALTTVSRMEKAVAEQRATMTAAEEARRSEMADALAERQTVERSLAAANQAQEREAVKYAQAEGRAQAAHRGVERLEGERMKVQAQLAAEKSRVAELQKARLQAGGRPTRVVGPEGESQSLQALLDDMLRQRGKLDSAAYSTTWREDLLNNINLCLRVLYVCEDEVAEKRDLFLKKSCAGVVGKGSAALPPVTASSSASAPLVR